jgi:hypothetical protein
MSDHVSTRAADDPSITQIFSMLYQTVTQQARSSFLSHFLTEFQPAEISNLN